MTTVGATPSSEMMTPRPNFLTALLALSIFAGLAVWSARENGITFDEPAHVTAGRAYWQTHDYRLQPENGLLPQRLEGLPAQLTDLPFPTSDSAAWRSADVWGVARAYLFAPGHDAMNVILPARLMMIALGVMLLVLLWRWSAGLWGEPGGLVTLGLAAFCPHLQAHSSLATSDIAAALGFTAALLAWWRLLHRISPVRLLIAAGATTFLALSKYSVVLLAPVLVLLIALRLARPAELWIQFGQHVRRVAGYRRAIWLGGAALVVTLVTWIGIWAGYGFRYSASATSEPARFAFSWNEVLIEQPRREGSVMADGVSASDQVELRAGLVQHTVRWARDHRLLPEAYLYGVAFVDRFSRHRLAYFAGEFRERGWREFFPAAFLLKTTLPALLVLPLAALGWHRHRRRDRLTYRVAPILIFAAIYWAAAIFSSLNIGHRHLLPVYPAFYLVAGAVALLPWRRISVLALALVGWQAVDAFAVAPHQLTFFNLLAGGPNGGHRFFVDSSLDWGQGLPALRRWLGAHAGDARVYLSYFGSDDPERLGLHATRIGDAYFDHRANRPVLPALEPGLYCVSATMLHRVYTSVRGPWTEGYELEYRRLATWLDAQSAKPASEWRDLTGAPLDARGRALELARLEQLRFGRLCRYLERRAPDAVVAHSVFIYRLNGAELATALTPR